jgi:peptidoglycan/LPS O-acetylase OafA/YrhL
MGLYNNGDRTTLSHYGGRCMRDATSEAAYRFHNLDAMRGLCAVLVALFHASWDSNAHRLSIVANGWLFVDYFFILSGFVISYSYLGRTAVKRDFWAFLTRRVFRLFPVHLLALMLILSALFVSDHLRGTSTLADMLVQQRQNLASAALLLHGLGFSQPTINAPSWSISTELWAYVVFALTGLLFGSARRQIWAMMAIGTGALICLAILNAPKGLFTAFEYGLPRCLAGFAIGVALYAVLPRHSWGALPGRYAYLGYTALGGLTWWILSISTLDSMASIAVLPLFAGIVALSVVDSNSKVKALLESRLLTRLGDLSYSTYMLHVAILMMVSLAVTRFLPELKMTGSMSNGSQIWRGDVVNIVYVVLILTLASVIYRFVEVPCRDYGKRLVTNNRRAVVLNVMVPGKQPMT